jgi:hypothetical protein
MAITGTHMLFYTTEAEKVRAMLRDVFGFKHVDVGDGWLIFRLPPSEIGVHPAEGPTFESGVKHQITFMCDDINTTIAELRAKGVGVTGEPKDEGWGITTTLNLPGGCDVMLYEPRHPVVADIARAKPAARKAAKNAKPAARRAAKKNSAGKPARKAAAKKTAKKAGKKKR